MKFGKGFSTHLEETLPEWRDKFLCYKPLKKFLKNLPVINHDVSVVNGGGHGRENQQSFMDLQQWFLRILNEELEKFNDFFVNKEEDFVIRLQELKERDEKLKEKNILDGCLSQDIKFSDEIMKIRQDFVTIHGEMVLLKNYSSLNFAGLIKILKKYDKRTGRLLCLPFTQLALNQPFFTMEPLTRLVHECEESLEVLFPLEAEVVESITTIPNDKTDFSVSEKSISTIPNDKTEFSTSEIMVEKSIPTIPNDKPEFSTGEIMDILPVMPSTVGGAMDIYRSTLAAIKTIEGLRKASSTYNPFSLGPLFRRRDVDSPGSVTGGSSPLMDSLRENSDDDSCPI